MLNFSALTRIAVRSILIQQGPQTCSDLVRIMGMDPQRHKGTIHAIMVDMEDDGILTATRSNNGKRNQCGRHDHRGSTHFATIDIVLTRRSKADPVILEVLLEIHVYCLSLM
jgi:hypothetical protein